MFTNNGGQIDGTVFVDNEGGAGTGAVVNSGTLAVTGSTFTGNTGDNAGAIYDQGDGLTVVNSTFISNSSDSNAGAIRSRNAPVLDHVTITGNTSGKNAGAVDVVGGTITNSIITSNNGGGLAGLDLTVLGGYVPNSGTITFTRTSIIGEDDTAFGSEGAPYNVINGAAEDIFVNVIEDNGGPTPTLALLGVAENPALDATNLISQNEDACGGPRPRDVEGVDNGGQVDLGAFELNVVNLNGVGIVDEGNFGAEEILGTDDNDTLQGGGSFEDSVAGSGQDTIRGFGGDDFLEDEGGADLIFVGDGDETIFGDNEDRFFADDRGDTLFGGGDTLDGGTNDDVLSAGDGFNVVDGGDDEDVAELSDALADYLIVAGPADGVTLVREVDGVIVEATTFENVETFRFADQDVAFDDLYIQPFIVTTLEDENDVSSAGAAFGGDGLSLREAIALATASDGDDVITFADGLEGTIRLIEGQLRSRGDLTIDGDGRIVITGDVKGNDITEDGITDVAATREADGDIFDDNVQAIRQDNGDLTLIGLTLTGGSTRGGGGAVGQFGDRDKVVTFIDSTVSGNFSNFDGGGVYAAGAIVVQNSVFSNNISGDDGGAIASYTSVDVAGSRITGNLASDEGGAILARNGSVTITDSEISGNTTTNFNGRNGDNEGGAVFADVDITITNSVISNNTADESGGLHAEDGDISLTGVILQGNTAAVRGAGGAYAGGAITATDSAFIANEGADIGALSQAGSGGAIANSTIIGNQGGTDAGAISTQGALSLDHVTITGNTSGAGGAAVDIKTDQGAATVANSIITGNEGGSESSSEISLNGGVLDASAVAFVGNNIVGMDESAFRAADFNNVKNGDPEDIFADTVSDNGGAVPTLALLASGNNPALDASSVVTQTKDGRGIDRPVDLPGADNGGAVDLGAFELLLAEDEIAPEIISDLTLSMAKGRSADLALTPVTISDVDVVAFSITGGGR